MQKESQFNKSTIITSDWMKDYQEDKLSEILIPGSHDSATYSFKKLQNKTILNFAQCQQYTIYEQLMDGVRFLDIRICKFNNEIWCSHTFLSVSFLNILNDILFFLNNHKKEVVILSVKPDKKSLDCENILKDLKFQKIAIQLVKL